MDSNSRTSTEQTTARRQGQRWPAVTAFDSGGGRVTGNSHIMEPTATDSLVKRTAAAVAAQHQQQQDGNVIVDTGDERIKGKDAVTRKRLGD